MLYIIFENSSERDKLSIKTIVEDLPTNDCEFVQIEENILDNIINSSKEYYYIPNHNKVLLNVQLDQQKDCYNLNKLVKNFLKYIDADSDLESYSDYDSESAEEQ
ncbi:hypothetical protein Catovirus_2_23 [Catovirus CTV1]|uniref:Uncharacterized protein n=1 Tax=Catovirus CTV1 TaxID=1977631 RepID=A0A1V0SBM7_9VIRU|nr:hypothetical protein Catovirus_2_23 [Catovirus CTV1]